MTCDRQSHAPGEPGSGERGPYRRLWLPPPPNTPRAALPGADTCAPTKSPTGRRLGSQGPRWLRAQGRQTRGVGTIAGEGPEGGARWGEGGPGGTFRPVPALPPAQAGWGLESPGSAGNGWLPVDFSTFHFPSSSPPLATGWGRAQSGEGVILSPLRLLLGSRTRGWHLSFLSFPVPLTPPRPAMHVL